MFTHEEKVLFKHCDPAGIVFFPRYFEMINDCVEHFFSQDLNWPFETVLKNGGVPTAEIQTRFTAPSRHGDLLTMNLAVMEVGQSSMRYVLSISCGAEARAKAEARLVHVANTGRPTPWPTEIADKLAAEMENKS